MREKIYRKDNCNNCSENEHKRNFKPDKNSSLGNRKEGTVQISYI